MTQRRTPRRCTRLAVSLALACATVGAAAEQSSAGCGGVKHARPSHIDLAHRPALAIGDSTMLLAVRPLAAAGFEANARGCRQIGEGLALIARLRRERRLAKVVLVHLGANWVVSMRDIERALAIIGPTRVLVMVTPREAGGGSGSDANVIRAAGPRWPRRVRVLDWVRASAGRRSWFSGDGLHPSFDGIDAFVRICRAYLPLNRPESRI